MRHFIQTSIAFIDSFGFGQGIVTAITLSGENALVLNHALAPSLVARPAPAAYARRVAAAVVALSRCSQRLKRLSDWRRRWLDRERMSADMRTCAAFCLG